MKEAVLPLTRDDVIALSGRLGEPSWVLERRLAAWEIAEALPVPTTSEEPWRRTDLRVVHWEDAVAPGTGAEGTLEIVPREMYRPLIGEEQGGLLVFANGRLVHAELNPELPKQGVIFTDLATAIEQHADLVREHMLTDIVTPQEGKFAALHAALWTHGTFLYIPSGVHVALPLHSVEFVSDHQTTGSHILAVLGENSSATYLHESASPTGERHLLHLGAIELLVGPDADLRFVRLQDWGENVISVEHQRGRVQQGGRLDWVVSEMGSRLSKVFTTLELDGNDTWGRISGLYFTHGEQHLDLDTQQNHHALRTTSDLLYKGGLRENSRTVWQGMIVVDPGAQQTDGYQVNRNIILDGNARSDSIPGLEIKADDVRCTHAAATGKLEEVEIFYLMSRGIPRTEAVKIVVQGFFDDVMQRIPFEEVRERIAQHIEQKLAGLVY
ncbi:MAG: Fe-S cluster assembly protein SufD [Anaerolineae bacterium]